MNANVFLTRFEIFMYSTLTSAMSGINHLRTKFQDVSTIPTQHSMNGEADQIALNDQPTRGSLSLTWESIKVALLPLCLWIILGFAAGFLIGMLKPR